MSQIKKLVQELENMKSVTEMQESKKVSISVRIEPQHVFKIDHLAEKYGLTRAAMATELLICAAMDTMTEFGYDDQEQWDMWLASLNIKKEEK